MPPPFRNPSQPGASVATKRAFKPPGPARAGASSSSSATSAAARTAQGPATTTTPWTNKSNGFTSAAELNDPDLEAMIITDDEDEDDDFGAAITAAASAAAEKRKTSTTVTSTNANAATAVAAPTKRPRTRLPSLSPMTQSSPPPAPTPAPATTTTAPAIGALDDEIPLLPSPLITRLLHESFRDKEVKIGKEANVLMARYLDVFVREAVARANEVVGERRAVKLAAGGEDEEEQGDVWLDAGDLEEVAPGLVLDF